MDRAIMRRASRETCSSIAPQYPTDNPNERIWPWRYIERSRSRAFSEQYFLSMGIFGLSIFVSFSCENFIFAAKNNHQSENRHFLRVLSNEILVRKSRSNCPEKIRKTYFLPACVKTSVFKCGPCKGFSMPGMARRLRLLLCVPIKGGT
jgi:hypothetical protein